MIDVRRIFEIERVYNLRFNAFLSRSLDPLRVLRPGDGEKDDQGATASRRWHQIRDTAD